MNPYKYKISIRLEHSSLDLTEVSEQIRALLPAISFGRVNTAGEERISRAGVRLGSKHGKSTVSFKFSDELFDSNVKHLDEALTETLGQLEACRALFQELAKVGVLIIFFVGVFFDHNSGITFESKLIHELSAFHFDVQLDIYPPDSSSEK